MWKTLTDALRRSESSGDMNRLTRGSAMILDMAKAATENIPPKPSAYFYKEIIENNGFKADILKKYLKVMPRLKDYKL